jgi:hypothetical protein
VVEWIEECRLTGIVALMHAGQDISDMKCSVEGDELPRNVTYSPIPWMHFQHALQVCLFHPCVSQLLMEGLTAFKKTRFC